MGSETLRCANCDIHWGKGYGVELRDDGVVLCDDCEDSRSVPLPSAAGEPTRIDVDGFVAFIGNGDNEWGFPKSLSELNAALYEYAALPRSPRAGNGP